MYLSVLLVLVTHNLLWVELEIAWLNYLHYTIVFYPYETTKAIMQVEVFYQNIWEIDSGFLFGHQIQVSLI